MIPSEDQGYEKPYDERQGNPAPDTVRPAKLLADYVYAL